MLLHKRYFDVVSAEGAYLIGYDARVQLGPAPLRYRALQSSEPAFVRSRYALGEASAGFPFDLTFGDEVRWSAPSAAACDVSAESGPISWRLDHIGFPVETSCGDINIGGLGYVETVRLCAPPWTLGMRTIRWGRFVGERVWACWNIVEGDWPIQLVAVNGLSAEPRVVRDDRVESAHGAVELGAVVTPVRDGDVMQQELSALAPLARLLAGRPLSIHQTKAVRRARITTSTGETEEGLAMDEIVRIA